MTKFVTKNRQWRSMYTYMVFWRYLWRSVIITVIAHDTIEKYENDGYLLVIFVSIDAVKKWTFIALL